jgi:hypothetical protein
MKNLVKFFGIIALVLIVGFSIVGCDNPTNDDPGGTNNGGNNNGGNNNGGGGGAGSSQEKAIPITVGYSSSHSINQSGQQWFKFVGNGEPVIFETEGNIVDTYMAIWINDSWLSSYSDDNSGAGSNALCTINPTTSGTTYYIRIETRNSTSGTLDFPRNSGQ